MDYQDHRIHSQMNRNGFLHVEYAVFSDNEKIKFFAGKFNDGDMIDDSRHYVDTDEAKFLCYQVLSQSLETWTSFKGGRNAEGLVMSRIMTIRKDAKDPKKFFVTVGHGPGVESNGKVRPVKDAPKEAWIRTSVVFSRKELTILALQIQSWLQACMVAQVLQLPTRVEV